MSLAAYVNSDAASHVTRLYLTLLLITVSRCEHATNCDGFVPTGDETINVFVPDGNISLPNRQKYASRQKEPRAVEQIYFGTSKREVRTGTTSVRSDFDAATQHAKVTSSAPIGDEQNETPNILPQRGLFVSVPRICSFKSQTYDVSVCLVYLRIYR